jgi:hypothetical protein
VFLDGQDGSEFDVSGISDWEDIWFVPMTGGIQPPGLAHVYVPDEDWFHPVDSLDSTGAGMPATGSAGSVTVRPPAAGFPGAMAGAIWSARPSRMPSPARPGDVMARGLRRALSQRAGKEPGGQGGGSGATGLA